MSPRDWKLRVEDILIAIAKVQRYTRGVSLEDLAANEVVVDAVLHNFAVIGEAARHIPTEVSERQTAVPWAKLRGMRNLVVHECFGVDLRLLLNRVQSDLPPLARQLERVLETEP